MNIIPTSKGRVSTSPSEAVFRGFWIALCLGTATQVTAAALAEPVTASNALWQVRELNRLSYGPRSGRQDEARARDQFRSVLADLATNSQPKAASRDEKLLVHEAQQISTNWALFDEILEAYGKPEPQFPPPRILRPRALKTEHLSESYRSSWETLLLAPSSHEIIFMRGTAANAISQIANLQSIGACELAFDLTCQPGIDASGRTTPPARRQREIIAALTSLPSEESLQTIFRCIDKAEAAGPTLKQHPVRYVDKDLAREASDALSRLRGRERDEWLHVLSTFPTNGLARAKLEFISRAKLWQ